MSCPSPCQCELAGYCERHGFIKTPHTHRLCQTRDDYRSKWDWQRSVQQRIPAAPTITSKIATASKAFIEWMSSGMRMRPKDQADFIYDKVCSTCDQFDNGKCKACGCHLKLKIALATTRCPLDPPKWTEESTDKPA